MVVPSTKKKTLCLMCMEVTALLCVVPASSLVLRLCAVFSFQVIQMNIEEQARTALAQELKINQSSQCPYVVVCYQSFYKNGVISIVLEYMDGGSLLDFLKKVKTIPEPYLAAICKQVGIYEL